MECLVCPNCHETVAKNDLEVVTTEQGKKFFCPDCKLEIRNPRKKIKSLTEVLLPK